MIGRLVILSAAFNILVLGAISVLLATGISQPESVSKVDPAAPEPTPIIESWSCASPSMWCAGEPTPETIRLP